MKNDRDMKNKRAAMIIEKYISLVDKIANKHKTPRIKFDNLKSVGVVGLIKVANTPLPQKGIDEYIYNYIEEEIVNFLNHVVQETHYGLPN